MTKGNKRLSRESFKAYRLRLKKEAENIKKHLMGKYIWLTTDIRNHNGTVLRKGRGTYIRDEHGPIGRKIFSI